MSATSKLESYIRNNRIDIFRLSKESGVDLCAILKSKKDLRADELVSICETLEVNPMNFADFKKGAKAL